MRPFRFGLQTFVAPTMAEWRNRARQAEHLGYSTLYVSDHLGAQFGPLVAATVAAEATTSLRVGTLVLNNDLRSPVVLAKEIATLGLAAEERIEVGLGAGWLRSDYEATGIQYDAAATRVDRLAESLSVMKALWRDGEATFEGQYIKVRDARCDPRPAVPPRVIVGGGRKRILTLAAKQADIVGIRGNVPADTSGGDLAEMHGPDHYDRCLEWVRHGADQRFASLELQISAIAVLVLGHPRAAARSATLLGLPGKESLDLPAVLIGTIDDLCERLLQRRERWGFSNIVIPGESMDSFAPVIERLAGK